MIIWRTGPVQSRAIGAGLVMSLFLLLAAGCASIGPGHLERDRLNYADAMSDSWEQQMLKNIVKLRYGESIFFLEVDSVINQYSVEATGRIAATPGGFEDNWLGATGKFSDRPTITYTPVRGREFIRQLLTPIPPTTPFVLAQSGWPIDTMFGFTVRRINGIANVSAAGIDLMPDPEFAELMSIFRALQSSRSLELRVQKVDDDLLGTQALLIFDNIPEELQEDALRAAEILGLDPSQGRYRVTYGGVATADDEISVLSRSVFEIMAEFSARIQIPGEHRLDGRAVESMYDTLAGAELNRQIRVRSGSTRPSSAYVAIRHQDHWFWIDEKDLGTKEAFSFLNILTQLTSTHSGLRGPTISIGAGS